MNIYDYNVQNVKMIFVFQSFCIFVIFRRFLSIAVLLGLLILDLKKTYIYIYMLGGIKNFVNSFVAPKPEDFTTKGESYTIV